jgi:hypothetical protein
LIERLPEFYIRIKIDTAKFVENKCSGVVACECELAALKCFVKKRYPIRGECLLVPFFDNVVRTVSRPAQAAFVQERSALGIAE